MTEACLLTKSNHPVSLFSRIHSVSEKGYQSTNTITFEALEQSAAILGKATFVMDRGYDANALFLKMAALEQDYVVRLKSNRKLLYHNKWVKATELRNRRKGKVKLALFYKGKKRVFQFENFRVRKLVSINTLNFYISLCMAFLALLSMASETHALKVSILQTGSCPMENTTAGYSSCF
ncbi:MAG: transposase, partial [Eubacterium sp.]